MSNILQLLLYHLILWKYRTLQSKIFKTRLVKNISEDFPNKERFQYYKDTHVRSKPFVVEFGYGSIYLV